MAFFLPLLLLHLCLALLLFRSLLTFAGMFCVGLSECDGGRDGELRYSFHCDSQTVILLGIFTLILGNKLGLTLPRVSVGILLRLITKVCPSKLFKKIDRGAPRRALHSIRC